MAITIRLSSLLSAYSGGAGEFSLSATSVREALETLERQHPNLHRSICDETGAVRRHVNVFVNSRNMRDLNGLDTLLTDGNIVTILQAVSGG